LKTGISVEMTQSTLKNPHTIKTTDSWLASLGNELPQETKDALRLAHDLVIQSGLEKNIVVEPLLVYARGIVEILISLRLRNDALVAAFICSTPKNHSLLGKLTPVFNDSVIELVEGVNKLQVVDEYKSRRYKKEDEKTYHEGLRKLLLGMAKDIRVVLIKLAERVQIMRDLKNSPEEIRKRISHETMDIFTPLANRLGIWQLKWELEDLSFRFLEPDAYQKIAKLLDERRVDRQKYINAALEELRQEIHKAKITAEVAGRPKHIYSIWRKMVNKGVDFQDLFDVRAVRILVNDIADCYAVLGIVHSRWQPIRGEFDDYIASPKQNLYQSLHTAVIGPDGKTMEIQIRTHGMHQHSEHGVAAHWGYKEGGSHNDIYRKKIAWLRQMLEWKDEERDSTDFIDRFKSEIFQDRVYILTPQGRVVDLPVGSTPLDFAYHIHTDIGHHYRGAKINGKIVPIHYELQNGEQVEILTSKQNKPSRDWLNPHLGYLKTSRARAKVRSWFRLQDYDNNVVDGRLVVERELHRLGIVDANIEKIARRFDLSSADDLYAAIGCGDITSSQIAGGLNEPMLPAIERRSRFLPKNKQSDTSALKSEISIMGVGDLATKIAKCCKPAPYDPIVGYITRGRGITIHRRECKNLLRYEAKEKERLIPVEWSHGTTKTYPVDIYVKAFDRQGLLHDITEVLSNDNLNVIAVNTMSDRKTYTANMTLTLDVSDVEQLSRALSKIELLPNIMEVRRKTS
jgi:GTP pyrophosphokinase